MGRVARLGCIRAGLRGLAWLSLGWAGLAQAELGSAGRAVRVAGGPWADLVGRRSLCRRWLSGVGGPRGPVGSRPAPPKPTPLGQYQPPTHAS